MKQSKILTQFYYAWLEWRDAGAEEHPVFDCNSGLCLQLIRYMRAVHPEINKRMYDEMHEIDVQFFEANLCPVMPFNDAELTYLSECFAKTTHLNPKRIQWVRDHV